MAVGDQDISLLSTHTVIHISILNRRKTLKNVFKPSSDCCSSNQAEEIVRSAVDHSEAVQIEAAAVSTADTWISVI